MEESKGTVTSLSSLFPAGEAQKAAEHLRHSITEREKELNLLQHFVSDNNNIIKLVQTLPHQLTHDVMVPFGKAAFFPGRLIHTNEFMVLLGDGYYAERTSRQTTEILQRRGQVLDSQVESLKAMMLDLQAEASFFNATASEAAEGLVEIREDYVDKYRIEEKPESGLSSSNHIGSREDSVGADTEDVAYARIMSRLDELEKEEDAAQSVSGSDEDLLHEADQSSNSSPDLSLFEESKVQYGDKEISLEADNLHKLDKPSISEKPAQFPGSKQVPPVIPANLVVSEDEVLEHTSQMRAANRKAFTGSVVERSFGTRASPKSQEGTVPSQTTGAVSNPSKPVSRFKMHKANR